MDEVVFLRCEDGSLTPDLALREKIVRMIRTYKPDVLITHDPFRPYALHPDHRAVGLASTDAVYPTARDPLYFPEHLKAAWSRTRRPRSGSSALSTQTSWSTSPRPSTEKCTRSARMNPR